LTTPFWSSPSPAIVDVVQLQEMNCVRGGHTPRVKLVVAILHHDDAGPVLDALLQREFRSTRVDSSGGFLRKKNATLMIGVEESDVDEVISIVRSSTKARSEVPADDAGRRKANLRQAVVFVIDLAGFSRV
jgi:uncharacterized protein YaaQ